MNGPSEFHVVGSIKDWQSKDRLGEIRVPTLLVSGRHDEATPALQQVLLDGIDGSEWVCFEESSHMPHVEERERYLQVVGDWLAAHGQTRATTEALWDLVGVDPHLMLHGNPEASAKALAKAGMT